MNIGAVGETTIPGSETKPRNIAEAAQAFEALFVGQLLKSAREAAGSTGFGESDNAASTMMEVAEEHFAREIAKGGGCGLAKSVIQQLDSRGRGNRQPDVTKGTNSTGLE